MSDDQRPAGTEQDPDDDVTVPGDHELLAELRQRAGSGEILSVSGRLAER